MSNSRNQRLGSGIIWTAMGTVGVNLLNLLRVMILARLLAPDDFGIFGMAMTVLLGVGALGNFGLKEAFIAHDYADDAERQRWLETIWTGNLVVKLVLAGLLAAAAWPTAWFYGQPELLPMVLVLALVPVFTACNNPALMLMEKRIAFSRVATFEFSVAMLGLIATVGIALITRSAWALVLGQVLSTGIGALCSYLFHRVRPRLRLEREPLVASLHFGKYLMAISVMTMVTTQFDNMLIGAQIGATALGIYVIAYRISEIPKTIIAESVSRALFPFYTETAAEGRAPLTAVWLESFGLIAWLVIAAYLPLIFLPEYFVVLMFGEQWRAAGPLLAILSVVGGLRGLNRALNPFLMAVKRTDVDAGAKLIETLVFVPAVFYGIEITQSAVGAAWAGVAAYGAGAICRVVFGLWLLRPAPSAFLLRMVKPLAGGLAMSVLAWVMLQQAWHPIIITLSMWLLWGTLALVMEHNSRNWLKARLRHQLARTT